MVGDIRSKVINSTKSKLHSSGLICSKSMDFGSAKTPPPETANAGNNENIEKKSPLALMESGLGFGKELFKKLK